MRMEKGSDICLPKKSSMAKGGMAYTRDLQKAFFFPTRKVFWNVSVLLVKQKRQIYDTRIFSSLLRAARIILRIET